MSLNTATASKPKADYGRVGEGAFPARIVSIVDLGSQRQSDWKTGEEKCWDNGDPMFKPEVFIQFELPTETITIDDEEKPRWLSKTYILSSHEKAALTGLMSAAGVNSTNVAELLDKAVSVTVGTTSGGKDKIAAVTPLMKGFEVAPLANPATVFDLDNPDMAVYDKLPNFIKEKLDEVLPKEGTEQPEQDNTPDDDSDPF